MELRNHNPNHNLHHDWVCLKLEVASIARTEYSKMDCLKKNLLGETNAKENGNHWDKADGLGRNVRATDSKGFTDTRNSC